MLYKSPSNPPKTHVQLIQQAIEPSGPFGLDAHLRFQPPQLIDLIKKCLRFDPNQRLKILEVLNHPWLSGPSPPLEWYLETIRASEKLELLTRSLSNLLSQGR